MRRLSLKVGKGRIINQLLAVGSVVYIVLILALSHLFILPNSLAGGPTYVHGILGSEDWTVQNSPYVITDDVALPSDHDLTVEAGVVIRFNEGTNLFAAGRLVVYGTETEKVTFTSNSSSPAKGDWGGLVFHGEANISWAVITYATQGIRAEEGASVRLENVEIYGILGSAVLASQSSIEIENCQFSESRDALLLDRSNAAVRSSQLSFNNHAIVTNSSFSSVTNSTMSGSLSSDVVLIGHSFLHLLNTPVPLEGIRFEDDISILYIEWYLDVQVLDVYGNPVVKATVNITDNENGTYQEEFLTKEEGMVSWVPLAEAIVNSTGLTSLNPYSAEVRKGENTAFEAFEIFDNRQIILQFNKDLEPPYANAGKDFDAVEDETVVLNASGSFDNDPDFPFNGNFTWTYYDRGERVVLYGLIVTHVFEDPGRYYVTLEVIDFSGNRGKDNIRIDVEDVTDPVADAGPPMEAHVGEKVYFDGGNSTDNDPSFESSATYLWTFQDRGKDVELEGAEASYVFEKEGNYSITLVVRDKAGNEAMGTTWVLVSERKEAIPSLLPIGLAILAGITALGVANTEIGKFNLFKFFFIPLYVKLKKKDILDNFIRGQIYGYIKVHPGDKYTDLKRNLELNNGTLTYHLDVLEREGLVISKRNGGRKLFYPANMRPPYDGTHLHSVQENILQIVEESPGIAIKDIASLAGVSRQLTNYHVKKLTASGFIKLERKGGRRRCFLDENRE